jgi:UPF0755 protein
MRLRYVLALGAVVLAAAGAVWLLTPTAAVRRSALVVEVPPHAGVTAIARRLEDERAVRSRWAFIALGAVRGTARSLKAGEYEIPQGASTLDVLRLLESGRVRQYTVLHPEGATVSELARTLEASRLARADDILRVAADRAFLDAQGIEGESVEGYLFPDTYQLIRGLKAEEILARMVQRMRAKLTPEIAARARALGFSVHQMLTLASIVEREAAVPEEQPLIAAVFWNRLRIDMPLQADPTVQYAVRKERRSLTRADLQTDHPYNTYRRPGLPPGPIASPGLRAIEATLNPAPVKYLYFVALSVDDRRHHFSTTVEEHNAAVARYRASRTP